MTEPIGVPAIAVTCVIGVWWGRAEAVRREGGRLIGGGGAVGSVVLVVAPLPSGSMVGPVLGVPGSASSAGRTPALVAGGGGGCSLDRLTA